MTVENMRGHILAKYPGWKAIRRMPDDQVIAIFYRLQKEADKKKEKLFSQAVPDGHYHCECAACYGEFITDNPDITECRHCGAPQEMLDVYRKGEYNK